MTHFPSATQAFERYMRDRPWLQQQWDLVVTKEDLDFARAETARAYKRVRDAFLVDVEGHGFSKEEARIIVANLPKVDTDQFDQFLEVLDRRSLPELRDTLMFFRDTANSS